MRAFLHYIATLVKEKKVLLLVVLISSLIPIGVVFISTASRDKATAAPDGVASSKYALWSALIVSFMSLLTLVITKYLNPSKDIARYGSTFTEEIREGVGVSALWQELRELRELLTSYGPSQSGSVSVDARQIVEMLRPDIVRKLQDGVFKSIDEEFAKRDLERRQREQQITDFETIHKRLEYETEKLARRSNLNLILGILITLVAGAGLVYIVFMHPLELGANPEEHKWRIVAHYIPRLSLIIFAQIFAYFFLRLYKTGLSDIKYYQNEITNVDLKVVALRAAMISPDPKDLGQVIRDLSRTERNFVLKRGETTVELEMLKADGAADRDLLKQVASYVRTNAKDS